MQTSLLGKANKAKQDKKYKFENLYELIDKKTLYEAWRKINKNSAAGIDKETAKEFKENLEENLQHTGSNLRAGLHQGQLWI